jgi:hypothetical protein
MKKIVTLLLFIVLTVACQQSTAAQQSVTPPPATVTMYAVHYEKQPTGWFQITYFEHDNNRCYVTREHVRYDRGYGIGGGISCQPK